MLPCLFSAFRIFEIFSPGHRKPDQQCSPNESCAGANPGIGLFAVLIVLIKQLDCRAKKQQRQASLPCRIPLHKAQHGKHLSGRDHKIQCRTSGADIDLLIPLLLHWRVCLSLLHAKFPSCPLKATRKPLYPLSFGMPTSYSYPALLSRKLPELLHRPP